MTNVCNCENNGNNNVCKCLRLGDKAPDFVAVTTHGTTKFSDYCKDHWVILFSHPADFTPVCTTEFLGFAQKQDEFDKRNVKLMGLSIDSVYSHIAWVRQIEKNSGMKIKFPIIADLSTKVARAYGMLHENISEVHAVRTVFIIDTKMTIRMNLTYPMSVGRNIDEIIRIIDALQLVDKESISTPANWKMGDSVIISPPQTVDEAEKRIHEGHEECTDWFLCKKKV
ncbi:MAG: peroxiredoxin [Candidatus Gastranaerophilales bacterium]|nr:peroxiredoxin [Candidatus Gastranaerophilales bacterium]